MKYNKQSWFKLVASYAVITILSACGGGGGGDAPSSSAPQAQTDQPPATITPPISGLPAVGLPPPAPAQGLFKLNDTGVRSNQCLGLNNQYLAEEYVLSYFLPCNDVPATAFDDAQDGSTGRDVTNTDNANGRLGFDFTKISATGLPLPMSALKWDCVRDNVTGLLWENKNYDNPADATAALALYSNERINSTNDASSFVKRINTVGRCGLKDWRLPLEQELHGLMNYGYDEIINIDERFFTFTSLDAFGWYWAAPGPLTEFGVRQSSSIGVRDTRRGTYISYQRLGVRLVHGGNYLGAARYSISSSGSEVFDKQTGLTWARCFEGQAWNGQICTGIAPLVSLVTAARSAKLKGGWRLPNIKEKQSLEPDISGLDSSVFPGPLDNKSWTSTPVNLPTGLQTFRLVKK